MHQAAKGDIITPEQRRVEGHTHNARIVLLSRPSCSHCVRLASTGLTVCEDGYIVALHEGVHALVEVFVYAFLVHLWSEYPVEDKQLLSLSLRGLNCQAC